MERIRDPISQYGLTEIVSEWGPVAGDEVIGFAGQVDKNTGRSFSGRSIGQGI